MSLREPSLEEAEHFTCTRCGRTTATERAVDSEIIQYRCQDPECGHAWDVSRETVATLSYIASQPDGPVDLDGAPHLHGASGQSPAGREPPQALAALASLAGEPPRPLHRELPPAGPFPMHALGEILGPAAVAIQETTQAPDAICAQSVLAAATLGVQALSDVELPTGAVRPLSSFFLSVASTGERKTSADDLAIAPVREREASLAADYAQGREAHERNLAVWEEERRQVLKRRDLTTAEKRAALEALGPRPDEPLKRVRAGDPLAVLPGRRLAIHLLVQPGVAAVLLSDPLLADQGMLSRLLVAAPEGTVGTRFWREPSETAEQNLRTHSDRLAEILSEPLPMAEGSRNELSPRTLRFSAMSRELWIEFVDHVEREMGSGGRYESIRGLANKLPEHATRLAGIVAVFQDPQLEELSEADLARGIALASFYANEALRLFEVGALNPDLTLAERLLQWLRDSWAEEIISLPDIYQRGPRAIRDQGRARKMVQILEDHGWLVRVPEGAEVAGTKRRDAWRIVRP